MLIKFIKSYDMWEEHCTGWFDLYSVDDTQVYPTSDYDDVTVPKWVFNKFEETLNGSKMDYEDVILSVYYDLIINTHDNVTFDGFCLDNIYNIKYLEDRLEKKLNVVIEVIDA